MAKVKESQDQELLDFVARRLMEMAADIIMAHLLIQDATKAPELFAKSAVVYTNYVEAEMRNIRVISEIQPRRIDLIQTTINNYHST